MLLYYSQTNEKDRHLNQLQKKKKTIITVRHDECYCGIRHRERNPEEVINSVHGIRKGFRWAGSF